MPPQPSLRVTTRDLKLMDALSSFRFMSIPQATLLFFTSRGSAEARLRALARAGLVYKVFMPVRPADKTSVTVFGLARRGAELLRPRHNGERPPHLLGRELKSGLHLEHTLKRNDVRLALESLGHQHPRFTVLDWTHDPVENHGEALLKCGRAIRRVPCVPDGVAILRLGSECQVLAVEVDRGTIPVDRMQLRYRAYWQRWRDGTLDHRYGRVPYRILTLTTTKARLEALRKAALTAPNGDQGSRLFWFGTLDAADFEKPEQLLERVFLVAHPRDPGPHHLFKSIHPNLLCQNNDPRSDASSSTPISDEVRSVPVAESNSADRGPDPE